MAGNNKSNLFFVLLLSAFMLMVSCTAKEKTSVGFIVKDPAEPWFVEEIKYAQKAAEDYGFILVDKPGRTEAEVMQSIEEIKKEGCTSFVICPPDVKLGAKIKEKAESLDLNFMTVDDQFTNENGKPMEDIFHLGISSANIGSLVGLTLCDYIREKKLVSSSTGILLITFSKNPSIDERIEGAVKQLKNLGRIPASNFKKVSIDSYSEYKPEYVYDEVSKIASSFSSKYSNIIIVAGNDDNCLAAVQALRDKKIPASKICAVGINGTDKAIEEIKKPVYNGFYGTVKLSSKQHGYTTAKMMFFWASKGSYFAPDEDKKVIETSGQPITRDNYKTELEE